MIKEQKTIIKVLQTDNKKYLDVFIFYIVLGRYHRDHLERTSSFHDVHVRSLHDDSHIHNI